MSEVEAKGGHRLRARYFVIGLIIALAAVIAGASVQRARAAQGRRAPPDRKVPVAVEVAQARDVAVTLEGLGTVTPLATVQMKSQVSGRLTTVAFKEGHFVHRGDVIAQVDPRPFQATFDQANSTTQRDAANLANSKVSLARNIALLEQKLVPQQSVDDQRSTVAQLEATVAMGRAAANSAKLQLEYARIVSPVDGVAGIRQVDVGNLVSPSDSNPIVVLTQLEPITVIFTLPQDDIPRVRAAFAQGALAVTAWSRDGDSKIADGKLAVIDNQINAATGTVRMRATFDNSDRALWPNQFVKARMVVEQKKGVLVISAASVQQGPKGPFVYVVGADSIATVKPIELDFIEGTQAIVKSGIAVGDRVVADGASQLKPGAAVDVRPQSAS